MAHCCITCRIQSKAKSRKRLHHIVLFRLSHIGSKWVGIGVEITGVDFWKWLAGPSPKHCYRQWFLLTFFRNNRMSLTFFRTNHTTVRFNSPKTVSLSRHKSQKPDSASGAPTKRYKYWGAERIMGGGAKSGLGGHGPPKKHINRHPWSESIFSGLGRSLLKLVDSTALVLRPTAVSDPTPIMYTSYVENE